jgi:crossover junction endodeoxyribonuclease RuvC
MNVAGIDQSLTSTGLVVLNDEGLIQTTKLIEKKPTVPAVKRMLDIATEIIDTLDEYGVKHVAIEGFGFGARGRAVFDLGGLGFIIRAILYQHDIQTDEVPPTVLKKFVTGKGNCHKDLMLLKVYKRWGIEFTSHDLADAYGLSRYVLQHYNKELNK